MSLAVWLGEYTEYAVAYDAPDDFAGQIANVGDHLQLAQSVARSIEATPGSEYKCHVVSRTVTYGEWAPIEVQEAKTA